MEQPFVKPTEEDFDRYHRMAHNVIQTLMSDSDNLDDYIHTMEIATAYILGCLKTYGYSMPECISFVDPFASNLKSNMMSFSVHGIFDLSNGESEN